MKNMRRCDSIFVAPHLDDVALSCALRLLQNKQQGQQTAVLSVFTGGPGLLPGVDLYCGRRREDKQALENLGVTSYEWLGFADAPFRTCRYWSFEAIIFGDQSPVDEHLERQITQRLVLYCKQYQPRIVLLPLAVGTHVDHRLVHRLWHALASEVASIVFYEDRPYIFLPDNLAVRLGQLRASRASLSTAQRGNSQKDSLRLMQEGLPRVGLYRHYLRTERARARFLRNIERISSRVYSDSPDEPFNIEPEVISTGDASDLAQIVHSISAYKSQLRMLFQNDMDVFEAESRTYAQTIDHESIYAERYWNLLR